MFSTVSKPFPALKYHYSRRPLRRKLLQSRLLCGFHRRLETYTHTPWSEWYTILTHAVSSYCSDIWRLPTASKLLKTLLYCLQNYPCSITAKAYCIEHIWKSSSDGLKCLDVFWSYVRLHFFCRRLIFAEQNKRACSENYSNGFSEEYVPLQQLASEWPAMRL